MATGNMNNLTTLIKRLEAATSRLEDIASSAGVSLDTTASAAPQQASTAPQSVSAVPQQATPSAPTVVAEELPKSIEDFDTLLNGDLEAYRHQSQAMGGLLSEQASAVVKAFQAERQVLLIATKSKKPDESNPVYMDILKDLQAQMTAVENIKQNNRSPEYKDHLALVADGVGALAWITFMSKPADSVVDLFGGAQMYGNKVLRQYKEKEESHVEWVKSFYKVMRSLIAYIKEHHAKGMQWNPQGIDPVQALKESKPQASTPAPASAPTPSPNGFGSNAPPPPPMPAGGIPLQPPPPPPGAPAPGAQRAGGADMGAVFADLQRGGDVTSGLKRVDPSMQTHKNPSLRSTAGVPTRSDSNGSLNSRSSAAPGKKPKPESMRTKKPPRKELDGNKWYIENIEGQSDPITISAEINQSILITKCRNTTIQITGKANAITIDNSEKTNLILDSLVSSIDIIKCPKFAVQILGVVPTILLDQVDGGTVYLSQDSLGSEVFTSKCTSINVYLPPKHGEEDYTEESIPEQFRSYIRHGRLVTEIVEHAG